MAANVNPEKCVGCEACVGACPVEAISMNDGKAQGRCRHLHRLRRLRRRVPVRSDLALKAFRFQSRRNALVLSAVFSYSGAFCGQTNLETDSAGLRHRRAVSLRFRIPEPRSLVR